MPRKIAGSAMMTMDPSRADMNTAAVVFDSATHLYRSPVVSPSCHQMLCASRSSSGAAAASCLSSAAVNPADRAWAICSVRAPRLFRSNSRPAPVTDRTTRLPSAGSGVPLDQPACLQRGERRPHGLRADLLHLGQRARGGRAGAVQPGEGRAFRHGEVVIGAHLAQAPQQQADADPQRRRDVVHVQFLGHIVSLA